MAEREIITVGVGNYATLVSAQWANGTSQYDLTRPTLYSEAHLNRVHGGAVTLEGPACWGRVRVPRLVLLDAPHVTRFVELDRRGVPMIQTKLAAPDRKVGDDGDGDSTADGIHEPPGVWNVDERTAYATWGRHIDPCCVSDPDSEEEEEADDRGVDTDESAQPTCEGEGESGVQALEVTPTPQHRLFSTRDRSVPWWQFIHTGVRDTAYTSLNPLHAQEEGGDLLLHSFGFGLVEMSSRAYQADVGAAFDSLRRELENADHPQGIQLFADSDSAFGGAAHNLMEEVCEDYGARLPVSIFSLFQPLPDEVVDAAVSPFAERRRQEMVLNRALATSVLSAKASNAYIPLELGSWPAFFGTTHGAAEPSPPPAWLSDDRATAQLVAAFADSALYGARAPSTVGEQGSPPCNEPLFTMRDWVSTVHPDRALRVASAHVAMPLRLDAGKRSSGGCNRLGGKRGRQTDDLSAFLHSMPLLPYTPPSPRGAGYVPDEHGGPTSHVPGFTPLTHATTKDPRSSLGSGRVLGHSVTLRGAGTLGNPRMPWREAMLAYAMPLRTSNYLHALTQEGYPVSATFPLELVVPPAAAELFPRGSLKSVGVGAHVTCTFGSAPMLHSIVREAQAVWKSHRHVHTPLYRLEREEWSEVFEDLLQLRDDYARDHWESEDDGDDAQSYDGA